MGISSKHLTGLITTAVLSCEESPLITEKKTSWCLGNHWVWTSWGFLYLSEKQNVWVAEFIYSYFRTANEQTHHFLLLQIYQDFVMPSTQQCCPLLNLCAWKCLTQWLTELKRYGRITDQIGFHLIKNAGSHFAPKPFWELRRSIWKSKLKKKNNSCWLKNDAVIVLIEFYSEMRNALNEIIPIVMPEVIRFLFDALLIPFCHFPCVISNLATVIFKLLPNNQCINKNMKRSRRVQIFIVSNSITCDKNTFLKAT